MDQYLQQYHDQEITDLLNSPNDLLHVSIEVSVTHLQHKLPQLCERIFLDTEAELGRWNECLLRAQKSLIEGNMFLEPGFQIKHNCHVRFVNLPVSSTKLRKTAYPGNDEVGQFLQVKGSVTRVTSSRFLEYRREYACSRCKQKLLLEAEYGKSYIFETPRSCPNAREAGCRGQLHPVSAQPQATHYKDYQEIRIQEVVSERNVPASLLVTLEDDLVDICQPGDCVTICGRIEHRWKPPIVGRRTDVTLAMRANSVIRDETKASLAKNLPEHLVCFKAEWQEVLREIGELAARDLLVQSIAPAIRGMYPVKLAIALALASCTERLPDGEQTGVRGHSHLLLVGDPGLAKSQLLKFATEIASRAVYTTGMGCSAAGLTAAAVKDGGDWQLEAGALVLADGGVCCIDEFNLMRETDQASIHEAMEQQTISVAKAGIVCKLSTRCVVLAAANPKKRNDLSEDDRTFSDNIGIGGPLLSRFDMVLILRDIDDTEWDVDIANHLLALALLDDEKECFDGQTDDRVDRLAHWELAKLQLHFAAIKDIHPRVSQEANMILGAYYRACRSDPLRNPTRTTVRLLDSLFRLAQAHARLLFRSEVTPIDAITIIQLMEASWGFGKIGLTKYDLITTELPLGPEQNFIDHLLELLNHYDTVPKTATVRQIDANILRRYHRAMIVQQQKEKERKKQSIGTDQEAGSPPPSSSSNGHCSTSTQCTINKLIEPHAPAHSKSVIQVKANLKKLRKPIIEMETVEETVAGFNRAAKKRKRVTGVEEDLSLNVPLDDIALGNLIVSLREHFQTEQNNVINGEGGMRDASFCTLLDTSQIFEDDDDDDRFEDERLKSLLTKPIVIDPQTNKISGSAKANPRIEETGETNRNTSFSELLDHCSTSRTLEDVIDSDGEATTNRSKVNVQCEPLDDTILNTASSTFENIPQRMDAGANVGQSVYQIKRSSQRERATDVIPSLATQLSPDDLYSVETKRPREIPLLEDAVAIISTPSYVPGLRTQTREKLQQFQFQPKRHDKRLLEDDSAYESILKNKTKRPEHVTTSCATADHSLYSGLFSSNEGAEQDVELCLSDIEL